MERRPSGVTYSVSKRVRRLRLSAAGRRSAMVTLFSMKRTVGFVAAPLLAINAYLAQPAVSVSMVSQSCGQVSVKEPPIDLRTVVDEFVKSIPAGKTYGYADPKGDPNGVNALVQGFAKIVDGDLVAACQVLEPVAYRVILTTDNNTGRDLVLLRETRGNNGYARAWGLYVISWLSAASSSALAVEAPHSCPYLTRGGCAEGDRLTHFVCGTGFSRGQCSLPVHQRGGS